jgi:hypothetical protein
MSYFNQPITITASATVNRNTHAGNTVNLSAARGSHGHSSGLHRQGR